MPDSPVHFESNSVPMFDGDRHNIAHIARHDVTPEEAEQVLLNNQSELGFQAEESGEERIPFIGETITGRILRVVVTVRGERLRVVTAFESRKRNKQDYLAIRAGQNDRFESS
jgi:uncharacterized DUF497 family protein